MKPPFNNLYSEIPDVIREEIFETLLQSDNFKLERIISEGHVTPAGQWLEQDNRSCLINIFYCGWLQKLLTASSGQNVLTVAR